MHSMIRQKIILQKLTFCLNLHDYLSLKNYRNIGSKEKTLFFRRKLAKMIIVTTALDYFLRVCIV
jgi:hypothetical protein